MILGISGSPRPNRTTSKAVQYILKNCEAETEYISLAGKHIGGCISCLGCTKDNICAVKDDFQPIVEALVRANAIVLGIPNYYDVPNALSHSLLERCFCLRHNGVFALQDKPVIIFSTGYAKDEENSQVLKIVNHFMKMNKAKTVSQFLVGAFSQCYTCIRGRTCPDGNIVKDNGYVDEVTFDMLPAEFEQQPEAIEKCEKAAQILNGLLR